MNNWALLARVVQEGWGCEGHRGASLRTVGLVANCPALRWTSAAPEGSVNLRWLGTPHSVWCRGLEWGLRICFSVEFLVIWVGMGTIHWESLLRDLQHDWGSEEVFCFVVTAFTLRIACKPAVQVTVQVPAHSRSVWLWLFIKSHAVSAHPVSTALRT